MKICQVRENRLAGFNTRDRTGGTQEEIWFFSFLVSIDEPKQAKVFF